MAKHASREESTKVMEDIYAAAFGAAQSWRKDHGAPTGQRKPPKSYKMTLWLQPWHYMQVCNDASRAGVSVTKYLQEQLTDPRLKAYLPTRENQKQWREEEKAGGEANGVTSLRRARLKRQAKMLTGKGAVMGDILPPGSRRHVFAHARRAAGLRR